MQDSKPTKDKSYRLMTDDELMLAHKDWENNVSTASGWASAHFAAKQVENICKESEKRGLNFVNDYPIKVG